MYNSVPVRRGAHSFTRCVTLRLKEATTQSWKRRSRLRELGEVTDELFEDTLLQGLTDDYEFIRQLTKGTARSESQK